MRSISFLILIFCFSICWAKNKNTQEALRAECAKIKGKWVNNTCVDGGPSVQVDSEVGENSEIVSDINQEIGSTLITREIVAIHQSLHKETEPSLHKETEPIQVTAKTEVVISCLQPLEQQIKDCVNTANETIETCNEESDKNADLKNSITSAGKQISAVMQGSGSEDSCRKAGLLSSTAGYGAGMISTSCDLAIKTCQRKCSQFSQYSDQGKIQDYCIKNGGQFNQIAGETEEAWIARVNPMNFRITDLSNFIYDNDEKCASDEYGKNTKAEKLLKSSILATKSFVDSNVLATNCVNTLSGKASLKPLTLACAMGTGTNCPVNCISNPGDASCKTVSGTASQLAMMASKGSGYVPSSLGAAGKVPTGNIDLGNLDLNDGTGAPATAPAGEVESAALFTAAAQANAGGGGSTDPGDKKDKAGGSGEVTEDKGFFGGTFSAMKSAVNRALGGGSFFGSKNNSNSSVESKINVSKKNSIIRGLANTGGATCYLDAKGSEYCFGRKNMDIFQMMNKQYGNQSHKNTFFAN